MQGSPDSPPETRERIVDAAILLFAEQGYEATSVRDITTTAECNVASVNYHFGGKEKLYIEAARSLLGRIQEQRMESLRSDMESQPAAELEDFLRGLAQAFVGPLVSGPHRQLFMSWFAREMVDQRLPPEFFFEEFIQPFMNLAMGGLERFMPGNPPTERFMSLMSVIGQLLHIVKGMEMIEKLKHDVPFIPGFGAQIEHVVRFSAAGIRNLARKA